MGSVWVADPGASPGEALAGLSSGGSVHGLSDGSWSVIDAVMALGARCGRSHLVVSTWTAARRDLDVVADSVAGGDWRSVRFLVDRSFPGRQPAYCAHLRQVFGDGAIRVWDCHAKFVLVFGGDLDVLWLTSANLNRNRRIENYSAVADAVVVGEYLALVASMWEVQRPGEGFDDPAAGRRSTAAVLDASRPARPVSEDSAALDAMLGL